VVLRWTGEQRTPMIAGSVRCDQRSSA